MNTNFFRTLLTWAAIIIPAAAVVFGCSTDALTGAIDCSSSWLPPNYAVLASSGFLILNQVIKALDGTTLTKPVK
jgi:hypothetical protein